VFWHNALEKAYMKKKVYIFIAIGIGACFAFFFLAQRLAPWFYAIDTSVKLKMDAPAETQIDICWDANQGECLPLVPYSEASNAIAKPGEVASLWLSELPPRPVYHVALIFKSAVHGAVFHDLELDSSKILIFGYIPGIGVSDSLHGFDQFNSQGVLGQLSNGGYTIESDTDGKLTLNKEISPTLSNANNILKTTVIIWMLLFSIFLLFIIPIYLLPGAVENYGSALKNTRPAKYPWWVYVLSFGVAGIMLLLIINSAVLINYADPIGYLQLATGGGWFNDVRLPGYPLFLGLALWASGNSLNGVILFQAAILVVSTLLCIWLLRKWLHPIAAVLFIIFCLFSPAQIFWARWILRESLFSSLVLFGITALLVHYTSRKPFSEIWLVIYAITCALALLVRENGIILPAAMAPVLIVELIKRLKSQGKILERLRSVFSLFAHYSIPVLAVGLVYVGFSTYNYYTYGYFQLNRHQTSEHYLARVTFTANIDSRGFLYPYTSISQDAQAYLGRSLYDSFIIGRLQSWSGDPEYISIFSSVINKAVNEMHEPYRILYFASILDEIGKNAYSLEARKSDIDGTLRQYEVMIYPGKFGFAANPDNSTSVTNELGWLSDVSKNLKLTAKSPDPAGVITTYYNLTQDYLWYSLILILALLFGVYILRFENPIFLAPIAFFIANGCLLLYTRLADIRFTSNLDVLLILQIVLGLSLCINRYSIFLKRIYSRPGKEGR
jgi:hypothetical protein